MFGADVTDFMLMMLSREKVVLIMCDVGCQGYYCGTERERYM
jgi:hypothetical protein